MQSTSTLGTYWLGLSLNTSSQQYQWLDRSTAGNGITTNYNPCKQPVAAAEAATYKLSLVLSKPVLHREPFVTPFTAGVLLQMHTSHTTSAAR
jgi:hypothetical protein